MNCQAQEMAIQVFDDWDVPECLDEATVRPTHAILGEFALCRGCWEALTTIVSVSERVVENKRREN